MQKKLLLDNWCGAFIITLCVALYGQTLGFEYVWDDGIIFLDKNSLVVDPLSWKLLAQPILEKTTYMRPFVMFTWWLEFRFFGQSPVVSHGVNVLIFILNVLLLRSLAKKILNLLGAEKSELWSLIAAVVYAVHPALIEATAWVSGRFDLLCTTGILAASLVFLNKQFSIYWRVAGVLIFSTLAVFSKELGVVTPAILFCLWMTAYANPGTSFFKNAKRALCEERVIWFTLGSLLALYFVVRAETMGGVYHSPWTAEHRDQFIVKMLPIEALKFYITLALWPFGKIGIFHPISEINITTPEFFWNLVIVISVIFTIWSAFFRCSRRAWLLITSLVSISLVLHFIPMTIAENIAQDRFITLPLAFICVFLVSMRWEDFFGENIKEKFNKLKEFYFVFVVGWIIILFLYTYALVPMWRNEYVVWKLAYQKNPEIKFVRHNFLRVSLESGFYDQVRKIIEDKISIPEHLDVQEQAIYANALLAQNDPESLNYLKGLLYALPPFHEMEDGLELYALYSDPSARIEANTYLDYSMAKLIFEADFNAALKYNEIASWYPLPTSQRGLVEYMRAAILFAAERKADANAILEKSANNYIYNKNRAGFLLRLNGTLQRFCENSGLHGVDNAEICKKK